MQETTRRHQPQDPAPKAPSNPQNSSKPDNRQEDISMDNRRRYENRGPGRPSPRADPKDFHDYRNHRIPSRNTRKDTQEPRCSRAKESAHPSEQRDNPLSGSQASAGQNDKVIEQTNVDISNPEMGETDKAQTEKEPHANQRKEENAIRERQRDKDPEITEIERTHTLKRATDRSQEHTIPQNQERATQKRPQERATQRSQRGESPHETTPDPTPNLNPEQEQESTPNPDPDDEQRPSQNQEPNPEPEPTEEPKP